MLNSCSFIGNLGADPSVRHTKDGKPVVNLSLAVSEKWRGKDGEQKESTEWVRVVVWNEKLGEVCQKYLKKGSKIYVSGKMKTSKYTDQAGVEKYSTEIELGYDSKMIMLGGKEESTVDKVLGAFPGAEVTGGGGFDDMDSEIPF